MQRKRDAGQVSGHLWPHHLKAAHFYILSVRPSGLLRPIATLLE
jgi:hypothetical protein